VVAAKLVDPVDEVMLITTGGVLIRVRVGEISEMSRATQGVTLINLGPDERLAGLEKIADREDQELPNGEADATSANTNGAVAPGGAGADAPEEGPAQE
jgi:DNA gyrase subunit A